MDPPEPRIRIGRVSVSPPRRITLSFDPSTSDSEFVTPPRRSRTRKISARQNLSKRPRNATTEQVTSDIPPISIQQSFSSSTCPSSPLSVFSPLRAPSFDDDEASNLTSDPQPLSSMDLDRHITDSSNHIQKDLYDHFVEAVFGQVCAIYQLSHGLFVVNGWNNSTKTVSHTWYHLARISVNGETEVACMCPVEKISGTCFHGRFIKEYENEQFPHRDEIPISDSQPFLVSRIQELEESIYMNIFSVPTQINPTLRNRAIVQFRGNNEGLGTWSCNKHSGASNCPHIFDARQAFQRIIQGDTHARDNSVTSADVAYHDHPIRQAGARIDESVSYQPRPIPVWARISSDDDPPPINTLTTAPNLIPLDSNTSTCSCSSERARITPSGDITQKACVIYGLTGAWRSNIELQKCHLCRRRYIGPDCRNIGLFNWNNKSLFSHQLLDDYTSSFTTSETPFTAWVTVVSRRYSVEIPFVHEKLFRAVWFSYIRLIKFDDSTLCRKCGSNPDALIFDGVSLSFHQKNVLETLRPPTTIHPDSTVRNLTKRAKKLQLLPDLVLRRQIRSILVGPSLFTSKTTDNSSNTVVTGSADRVLDDESDSDESASSNDEEASLRDMRRREVARLRKKQALLERIQLIPTVTSALDSINPALGSMFKRHFGTESIHCNQQPALVYFQLFIQISAEETALQMMNFRALKSLHGFLQKPDRVTASNLILTPALYNVIQHEISILGGIHPDTFGTASWLYIRGEVVRQTLLVHHMDVPDPNIQDLHPWQETGCYYGMPQIRHRPQYPHLKEDQAKEPGRENVGGCRKFFSTYSPKKLTGGIMVAWCSHSVSYGFHCIPVAEGRNDVFSALYTRWAKAPPILVYDFACALQPYCMLREPEFFQDTLFVIDAFHAKDHSKCCPSSFLTTYSHTDPRLSSLNSSAGECGNSGLARIRKAVSYMSQDRAVMFCMVFLAVWNRYRIREMEKLSI